MFPNDVFKNYSFKDSLNQMLSPFSQMLKKPKPSTLPGMTPIGPTPSITPPYGMTPKIGMSPAPVVPQVKPAAAVPTMNAVTQPVTAVAAPSPSPMTLGTNATVYSPKIPEITPNSTPGASSKPTLPTLPSGAEKARESAEKAYQDSLKISPEELSTQEDLDRLIESTKGAYRQTSGQTIPLEFITGQLKSVEERALGLAEPLERKLARMQAARQSSSESSKFALERADKELEREKGEAGGFTLGEGQARYDASGKLIASSPKGAETKAPTTMETASGIVQWDPTTGTWKSTGYSKAQTEAERTKAGDKVDADIAKQQQATQSIGVINSVLQNPGSISGIIQTGSVPFTAGAKTKNQYEQLKAMLALGARGLLKGSGAVSDYESRILNQSTSDLGRNLTEEDFTKSLKRIRGVLKTNNGLETEVSVTNPTTGEVITTIASGDEIYALVAEGNVVEYQ